MSESRILRDVHLRLGQRDDVRLFRQNVGLAYPHGQVKRLVEAVMRDDLHNARRLAVELRPVKFGVPGQSDLIGLVAPDARFLAVECKTNRGRESEEQVAFGRMVTQMGGIYIVARSADEAEAVLEGEVSG